jgi:hypothetical protein
LARHAHESTTATLSAQWYCTHSGDNMFIDYNINGVMTVSLMI